MRHSLEELSATLEYDPLTGQLWWKGRWHVGRRAGTVTKEGYLRVAIHRVNYKAHRLAWALYHQEIPPSHLPIDHINHDPRDNRIINLRLCTNQENSQNMMRSKANTTGSKGVSRCGARFRAYINQDRRQIHLGVFATSEEAHAAYVRAAESLGWPVYCSG